MTISLTGIFRFPVKGLAAEALDCTEIVAGETITHDRRFAIAHGSTELDPANPTWLPKTAFLMLMRDEKLAQLAVHFEPESGILTLTRKGKQVVRAKVTEPLGRTLVSQFFAQFMAGATRGAPKLVEAPGHSFSDSRGKYISILNLASVRDLERVVRQPLDPMRFRANLHLDGLPPWQEFAWTGKSVRIGETELEVVDPIERCAATNVNPATAERDLNLPLQLQRGFGHLHMGLYATVVSGGTIRQGDAIAAPD